MTPAPETPHDRPPDGVRIEMSGVVEGHLVQIGHLTVTLPGSPELPSPQELPPPALQFIGRSAEIARLDQEVAAIRPPYSPLLAVTGMPGVGKTALSIFWAHSIIDRYPDGSLFADLRGIDTEVPMKSRDVLGGFLRALGVDGADVPEDTEERGRRYRSILAGKRMVVILDNAADSEQVRPLLPAAHGCVTLVTSRDRLTPLVVREGAKRVELRPMADTEGAELVRTIAGEMKFQSPDEIDELVRLSGKLPLTLRIASVSLASDAHETARSLLDELSDPDVRIRLFSVEGDPRVALDAVFASSYHHLSELGSRTFRHLAAHPDITFDGYTTAALLGAEVEAVTAALRELTRKNLVELDSGKRLRLHDLLRLYARELWTGVAEDERRIAERRLVDHYILASRNASAHLGLKVVKVPERAGVDYLRFGDLDRLTGGDEAQTWFDGERVALVNLVTRQPDPAVGLELASGIVRYLQVSGHFQDATTVAGTGLEFARALDNPGAEAELLYELTRTYFTSGRIDEAFQLANETVGAAQRIADPTLEGDALNARGAIQWRRGQYKDALDSYRAAFRALAAADDRGGQGAVLLNIGLISERTGDYANAFDSLQQALALLRESGDKYGELVAFDAVGLIQQRRGEYDEARISFEASRRLAHEAGDRAREAGAIDDLGVVARAQGRLEEALGHHQEAMEICTGIEYPAGLAEASGNFGEALLDLGRVAEAIERFDAAIRISLEIGDVRLQAVSLRGRGKCLVRQGHTGDGLRELENARALQVSIEDVAEQARTSEEIGDVFDGSGDRVRAEQAWTTAVDLYERLRDPRATSVRQKLDRP